MNVHLYPSVLKNETRILKIVHSLRVHGVFTEIGVVGRDGPGLPAHENLGDGIHLFRLRPVFGSTLDSGIGKVARTLGWYLAVLGWMRKRRVECLNCHSLPVLPLSVLVKLWKRCILVYDTHELETETNGLLGFRKWLSKITESLLINCCNAVSVVNKSIELYYKKKYDLNNIWVIHNVPRRMDKVPKRNGLLRSLIGLNSADSLLFIYQGVLGRGRGIEILLDVFSSLDERCHLVFMGYGPMENLIFQGARSHSNIHYVPAVSPDLVKDYTVDADFGFAIIENTCLSYYMCSPNKLYEYVSCGVVPIVSNFPEMQKVIKEYDCGILVDVSRSSIFGVVEKLDGKVHIKFKKNLEQAARKICWENEEVNLLNMYRKLGCLDARSIP